MQPITVDTNVLMNQGLTQEGLTNVITQLPDTYWNASMDGAAITDPKAALEARVIGYALTFGIDWPRIFRA